MDRRLILKNSAMAAGLSALTVSLLSAPARAGMGESETKHAQQTMMTGALSLATSRIAVESASDTMVKKFATFEVAEQETIADILKSMQGGDTAQGALQVPTDTEVEAMLDAIGKSDLASLRGMKGADFDKAYVTAQVQGHRKLLDIQETYLKAGQNREHLSVAKLARGMIREHLDHLEMLQAKA